jgi:hypothetical protein
MKDESNHDLSLDLLHPSVEQIELAVKQMNGCNKNLLLLCPDINEIEDGEVMSIGGGEKDQYFCSMYGDDGTNYYLVNTKEDSEEIVYIYIGQTSGILKKHIINFQTVLLAIKTYVEQGKLNTNLCWESQ